MRTTIPTEEFQDFYNSSSKRVQEKIDYIVQMMEELNVVNTKFVKKLENTEYYEMRISVGNEYRVILFTMDSPNFMQAKTILLLNGFIKKSTNDYKAQIARADIIKCSYYETETESGEDSEAGDL